MGIHNHDTGQYFVSEVQLAVDVASTLQRFDELRAGHRDSVTDSTGLTDRDVDDGLKPAVVTAEMLGEYEAAYRERWAGTIALIEADGPGRQAG